MEKRKRRVTKCYFDMFLKKFCNTLHRVIINECGNDANEFFTIGQEQLMYAMIYFDPKKYPQTGKGSFHTYLYCRVRGRTQHAIKKTLRHQRVALVENGQIDTEKVLYKDNDIPMFLEELMKTLSLRERDVIRAYFLESKTLAETAEELGVSTGTVGRDRDIAIAKLRKVVSV
jgi:RNA polymerase sigma factor (sigma-70 family)